ncbi:MAG: hypothetical protein M3O20_01790 [Acidobacteriota bacterium]|nr:hypothetical protein [Acidobacteriota bacterium]
MTPEITPTPAATPEPPPFPAQPQGAPGTLRARLWIILFSLFAFEIGAFLVVFPWMDSWSLNHIPSFFASNQIAVQDLWDDPYFRSALSCLGFLNVYIALRQLIQLIRRSKQMA